MSNEVVVDAPLLATTGRNALAPKMAFDGTNYLVVWGDARSDTTNTDIWGTRIAQDGTILDPAGIKIAETAGVQAHPAIAFDGHQFVVAWEDYKVPTGTEADIAAATVSTAGVVAALPAIATTTASETGPVLTSNGGALLATWTASGQIVGATFDGSFGAPFAITSGTNVHRDPAIAANPSGDYLVVFTETRAATDDDTRGQFVDASGALVGSAFDISIGTGPTKTAAAIYDGTNFEVVWSSYYTGVDIYGARITAAGAILDTHLEGTATIGGKLIDRATNYQEAPSIACLAMSCLVVWQDKRNLAASGYDVYAQRLLPGLVLSGTDFPISTAPLNQTFVQVLAGSGSYFAIWQDARAGANAALRVAGTQITDGGAVVAADGLVLNPGHNGQLAPVSARSGATVAVGWNDSRALSGDDVLASRFDASGALLDASPRTISNAGYAQVDTTSAGFGANFLYAWTDNRSGQGTDIYAARVVAATGALLDATGVQVSLSTTRNNVSPAVASSGTEALVVWENAPSQTTEDVYGAFVSAAGVASAPFVISNATGNQQVPAVTYDAADDQYIVAWSDTNSIFAARVTSAAGVLDPGGIAIATAPAGQRHAVKIASVGSTILAVYQDTRAGNWDVFGTRLTAGAALTVLDPTGIALTTDPGNQLGPTVSSFDTGFLVAWSDQRASMVEGDIWAQRLASSGALINGNFLVSSDPEDEGAVSLVDVSHSSALISYRKQRTDIDASRVVTRMISLPCSLVSIAVTPHHPSIHTGQTVQFTATGTYSDGSTQDLTSVVTWKSSEDFVAAINGAGLAKGLCAGKTRIVASLGSIRGSATLDVTCHGDRRSCECRCDDDY